MLTNDNTLPQLSLGLKFWLNLLLGLNRMEEKQNEIATSPRKEANCLNDISDYPTRGFSEVFFSESGKVATQKTYR